jgi:hypothetical protein
MSTREYKQLKGLKSENLRDNMTNLELILNMLAEATATDLSARQNPQGFNESANVAREGAKAAKVARQQIETSRGETVISNQNAKSLRNDTLRFIDVDKKDG